MLVGLLRTTIFQICKIYHHPKGTHHFFNLQARPKSRGYPAWCYRPRCWALVLVPPFAVWFPWSYLAFVAWSMVGKPLGWRAPNGENLPCWSRLKGDNDIPNQHFPYEWWWPKFWIYHDLSTENGSVNIVYLPTFTIKINQTSVNLLYMDPMGKEKPYSNTNWKRNIHFHISPGDFPGWLRLANQTK